MSFFFGYAIFPRKCIASVNISLCVYRLERIDFRRRDKQTITHLCKAGFVACQRQLPIHNIGHDIIPVVIIIIIIAGRKREWLWVDGTRPTQYSRTIHFHNVHIDCPG